jgi:hypothetical protein
MAVRSNPAGRFGTGDERSSPRHRVGSRVEDSFRHRRNADPKATHYVSAIAGGMSCTALAVGAVPGLAYAADGAPRSRRIFQIAVIVAAALLLVWSGLNAILPREIPSD